MPLWDIVSARCQGAVCASVLCVLWNSGHFEGECIGMLFSLSESWQNICLLSIITLSGTAVH